MKKVFLFFLMCLYTLTAFAHASHKLVAESKKHPTHSQKMDSNPQALHASNDNKKLYIDNAEGVSIAMVDIPKQFSAA